MATTNILKTQYLFLLFFCSACKKFVQIPPPENQVSSAVVFSNDQDATSAVLGLYGQMMKSNNSFFNGLISQLPAFSADELTNTSPYATEDEFINNALTNANSDLQGIWSLGYNYIYQANAILEGLSNSGGVSKNLAKQYIAESKFVRAICYFYLTNLFGNVPLETTTNYELNANLPQAQQADIYQLIVSDLKDSKNDLPEVYPTVPGAEGDRTRPNKWAATAFLAKVYLFQSDYADAATEAGEVINSGAYVLEPSLNDVFLAHSREAIWQLQPVNKIFNTAEGLSFVPFSPDEIPSYTLLPSLINSFETNDQRKADWIGLSIVAGTSYYYPYKYKVKFSFSGPPYEEYNMVLRLAEQYLIRAEAMAKQNKLAEAQADLNVIRLRAGLPGTTATDQPALLTAIIHENQVEYFAEWGHRWLDLKRTGQIDAVLGPVKGSNWQSTDTLYPISLYELQHNSQLKQNPGY